MYTGAKLGWPAFQINTQLGDYLQTAVHKHVGGEDQQRFRENKTQLDVIKMRVTRFLWKTTGFLMFLLIIC